MNAIYVMVSMEQPRYAPVLTNAHELSHFDLMVTYSLASTFPGTKVKNMPITYFPLNILSTQSVMHNPRPIHEKNGYNTGIMGFYLLCYSIASQVLS
jgi:hypothetical protein